MSEPRPEKWTRVTDGFYALDGWRIQRHLRCWSWWYVITGVPGIAHSGARGRARTLADAKTAVAMHRATKTLFGQTDGAA